MLPPPLVIHQASGLDTAEKRLGDDDWRESIIKVNG
jgi:hypothetical protein